MITANYSDDPATYGSIKLKNGSGKVIALMGIAEAEALLDQLDDAICEANDDLPSLERERKRLHQTRKLMRSCRVAAAVKVYKRTYELGVKGS